MNLIFLALTVCLLFFGKFLASELATGELPGQHSANLDSVHCSVDGCSTGDESDRRTQYQPVAVSHA